jgi:hypothetical protein
MSAALLIALLAAAPDAPVLVASADVGATALDWYTRTVEAQPIDPNRPTFLSVKVRGTLTFQTSGTGIAWPSASWTATGNTISTDSNDGISVGTGGITATQIISSTVASGNNGLAVTQNGARIDFGAGASDYASSDGTTVTFAGPVRAASSLGVNSAGDISTQTGGALQLNTTTNRHYFLSDGTNLLGGVPGTAAAGTNFGIGGTLNVTTADVTSSGASNLISYTLPANALVVTNRCLRIKGWGTALNNANAKTVALDFGSQTIISKILTPSIANTTWSFQATVCRSGSNTQDIYAEAFNPMGTTVSSVDANTVLYQAARTAGTQTETATIVIKGKTTAATTTDVTMDGLTVEYL